MSRLRAAWKALTASRASQGDTYPSERVYGLDNSWQSAGYETWAAMNPGVNGALRIRGDAIANTPLVIYRDTERVSESHPIRLLLERPNPWMTGNFLWKLTEQALVLFGRAFMTIEPGETNRPELWPVIPSRMVVRAGAGRQYIRDFVYHSLSGENIVYQPHEVVMLTIPNPIAPRAGLSPVAAALQDIQAARSAQHYTRDTFDTGGVPDFLMTTEAALTPAQVEQFYERWDRRFQEGANTHRPALVGGVNRVDRLGFSARDLEYVGVLRHSREQVAAVTGVPVPFLGSLERATYDNVQALERFMWRTTVIPQLRAYEAMLNYDLLPKLGAPGLAARFDITEILEFVGQENDRVEREATYLDRGVMTINEVRAGRGLPPLPDGDDPDLPSQRIRPRSADATIQGGEESPVP